MRYAYLENGDFVNWLVVRNGYARVFRYGEDISLCPQLEEAEKLATAIQSLEGARVEIKARATEKGGLFKSIGTKEITAAIAVEWNIHIPESVIVLMQPIKTMGEYPAVAAALGVKAEMTVVVAAS